MNPRDPGRKGGGSTAPWVALRLVAVAGMWLASPARAGAGAESGDPRSWWAFQPIRRPAVPAVPGDPAPIDAFIRARLGSHGLEPAPPADRRTLVRRLHHDLWGLPPDAAVVETAEASPDEAWFPAMVDELLAAPRFGERWGRHWLDVVGFAETNGYERDAEKPGFWKYRDWVIRAFNDDLPYDRFVLHQLAGDEVPERDAGTVIATGMLRAGTWNDEPNDPGEYTFDRLEAMVHTVSTAFLGLTVRCARCHDHFFDPIPQRDYYRFATAFWAGFLEPRDAKWMGGPAPDELGVPDVFGWTDRGASVPALHVRIDGEAGRPGEVAEPGFLSLFGAIDGPVAAPPEGAATTGRRRVLAERIVDPRNPLTARVFVNRIWLHLMGEGLVTTPDNFGTTSQPPSHPDLLDWLATEFVEGGWRIKPLIRTIVLSDTYRQASVHTRAAACRDVDASNRLLWRANRRRLDAETLRDSLLACSGDLNLAMGGPSFRPRLADEVLDGFSRKAGAWTESPPDERRRRGVYMMTKRHLLDPLMTAFDFPSTERPCGRRNRTTVATQALALLNHAFVHERSESLAGRLLILAGTTAPSGRDDDTIRLAWRHVLARNPTSDEVAAARAHLTIQRHHWRNRGDSEFLALASLCHVLMNSNEFLHVD